MQIHFLGFFLLLFFHCEGICGNSLHSYKHQCIFWLSSLLVVVCTFQAEQLFVAGHRYNKMWFFSGVPSSQVAVCSRSKVDWKVLSSVHCYFLLWPTEVDVTKRRAPKQIAKFSKQTTSRHGSISALLFLILSASVIFLLLPLSCSVFAITRTQTHTHTYIVHSSDSGDPIFSFSWIVWKTVEGVQSKRICDGAAHHYKSLSFETLIKYKWKLVWNTRG